MPVYYVSIQSVIWHCIYTISRMAKKKELSKTNWITKEVSKKHYPYVTICINCGDEVVLEFEQDRTCNCGYIIVHHTSLKHHS